MASPGSGGDSKDSHLAVASRSLSSLGVPHRAQGGAPGGTCWLLRSLLGGSPGSHWCLFSASRLQAAVGGGWLGSGFAPWSGAELCVPPAFAAEGFCLLVPDLMEGRGPWEGHSPRLLSCLSSCLQFFAHKLQMCFIEILVQVEHTGLGWGWWHYCHSAHRSDWHVYMAW